MNKDILKVILAVLTTLPALAWNVNAVYTARKYYKENKKEIKEKQEKIVKQVGEEVKKGAENVQKGAQVVQKEAEKLKKNVEKQVKEQLYEKDDPKQVDESNSNTTDAQS